MGAYENITDKIVLLLMKTRDTLLKDLEKEFSGLRKALEQVESQTKGSPSDFNDALKSTQEIFDSCEQVVKAVFAQVGVDISQCGKTEEFAKLLTKPLALVDTLAEDVEKLAGSGETDYAAIAQSAFRTFKDLMQLVKDFQNVEMDKIGGELEKALGDAWEKFSLKDFAMSILEYILITILRNGREVFADEIKYVKLQANALYTQIDSTVKDVRGKIEGEIKNYIQEFEKDADQAASLAKTLFRESVDDMEDVYNALATDIKKGINDALNSQTADEIREVYEKVSGILSKTYAILDFFGIVGMKTVAIRLPKEFISKLKSAAGKVSGALQGATDEISGFVRDITEEANGTISYVTGTVQQIAGPAHDKIQKAAGAIGDLTGTSLEELDITADLVNLPAVGIPDFSTDIEAAGSALSDALSKYVGGGINYLEGFSFPISIPTFRWGKVEKMFTDPQAYFLEQYPVNSIEDAEAIATKVIDIVRLFNPDIPDFSSIRSMLESLLRELGEKVLTYAKDATAEVRKELWTHVKPLMTMIRKVLDLLEEMYEALKRDAHNVIQEIKRSFLENVIAPLQEEEKKEEGKDPTGKDPKSKEGQDPKKNEQAAAGKDPEKKEGDPTKKEGDPTKKEEKKELSREVKEYVQRFKKDLESIKSKETAQKAYDEILKPAILEAVKKTEAEDPDAVVKKLDENAKKVLEAWGTGVHTHLTAFFKKDAWELRMDNKIASLETTFAGDVSAIKSFLTPSSLNDLLNVGGRAKDLKSSMDISQYITLISEVFDNVSIPNAEIYFDAFKQSVGSIFTDAEKAGTKFEKGTASEVAADVWEKVRNQVLMPLVREVKAQVRKTVRKVVKDALDQVLDQLPSFQDAKAVSDKPEDAAAKLRLYTNKAEERIADVKNLTPAPAGGEGQPPPTVSTKVDGHTDVEIAKDWLKSAKNLAFASVEYSESEKSYADVISLVGAVYKSIPEMAKDAIADILPSLPDNEFMKELSGFFKQMDFKGDLDKTFAVLTVVNMKTDKDEKGDKDNPEKKQKPAPVDDGKAKLKASALLQLVVFAGEVPKKVEAPAEPAQPAAAESDTESGESQAQPTQQSQAQPTAQESSVKGEKKTGEKGQGEGGDKKEVEKEPALFFTFILRGEAGLTFSIGQNHTMSISVSGGTGSGEVKEIDEKTSGALQNGIGFHVTRGWDFTGDDNWESLMAMFCLDFKRKTKGEEKNPLKLFDTKYLSMEIGNYPQLFYLGFSKAYPAERLKEFGIEEKKDDKKDGKDKEGGEKNPGGASQQNQAQGGNPPAQQGGTPPAQQGGTTPGQQGGTTPGQQGGGGGKMPEGNKLQVGYVGAVKEALVTLHLQDVAFVKEVLKDDIRLGFDTYIWYDYHEGFDFGGDVRLHLDFDLDHKKIGPLTIETFSVDAGSVKDQPGKAALTIGTTFEVDFGGALVVAVEDLGIGFVLKYKNDEGKFGDFDLDASLKYPSGFGISIDAEVVKGAGLISFVEETGEFFGMLNLDILKKIQVLAYLLCDPGTAEGHFFSLVVLLSAHFTPGIPLGMGFSLTAVGGTLGLNRAISRDAVQNGVRTGSLGQVFFAQGIEDHLAEMRTTVASYFPSKNDQFFFGILAQISYEPVLKCDFGLLLQLPKPLEIIIVGALQVKAAEGVLCINSYFAGGINFSEGMWFDSSIVDSQIAGISISGDSAFRLNWGGTKGFLLSIGGFHPAYKPEEGLHVGTMKRLAMRLDYSKLKVSFETYLAVTSNTFQIGARFDIQFGWKKFGINGYAGFDALFQFNPFLFLFNACAYAHVVCGSWELLNATVDVDVQGPAPWIVAAEAHFRFLGLPVDVDFHLSWGRQTPRLPDKQVEVFPLLVEQWNNICNWTVDNGDLTGKNPVVLFNHETDEFIIQPEGSLSFNQSAIPFYTKGSLEKMDLCNDAVPSDYDSLKIFDVSSYVGGITKDDVVNSAELAVGQVYHGKVVSILEFGAYVEILPGKEGLLHISEISWTRIKKIEDVLKVGDEVDVEIIDIDAVFDRMHLSMRSLTEKPGGNGSSRRGERRETVVVSFVNEVNDFAPVLYRNLSIKEKLKSESYVKYNSGFTLDEKDKRESTGTVMSLTRAVQFETRPLSEQTTSSPVTIDKNYSLESTSNNRKSRVAFERYIAGLDKKSGR